MPNPDSPYGGRIIAREDGSVLWQAAAREFPRNRDTDGTLEYAIRLVTADRNIFSSRDGKCLVHVSSISEPGTVVNANTLLKLSTKFLIVSGYDAPEEPAGARLVGKSYYITADTPKEGSTAAQRRQRDPLPPTYDIILRYDDYDLERAGLQEDLEPSQLTLCYQHVVSVRTIWEYYHKQPLLAQVDDGAEEAFRQEYGIGENQLKFLLAWTRTYHHLLRLDIPKDKIDELQVPLADWSHQPTPGDHGDEYEEADIWLSCWKAVRVADPTPMVAAAPAGAASFGMTTLGSTIIDIKSETVPLVDKVRVADAHFGEPVIKESDLKAETEGRPISGLEVTATRPIAKVDGSRSLVASGITRPATFVLVCDAGCI